MFHNKKFIEAQDAPFTMYAPDKYKSMREFVISEYPYDVEIANDKVEAIYNYRNLPRAILFTPMVNRSKEVLDYALKMKPLGRKFDGKINLYLQDADPKTVRKFKLHGDANFIIFDTDMEHSKYRYTGKVFNGSIDVDALIDFTQRFFEKKVEKYIRTSEINKDDLDEPVYPVVASTFESVVNDPNKHVFIRFYDKMMQRYTEHFSMRKEWWKVGKNYTANTKGVLVCEIEINDNDVPGYFTREMNANNLYFFLFTKKQKQTPYAYRGKIDANSLIAFAEEIIAEEDKMKIDL